MLVNLIKKTKNVYKSGATPVLALMILIFAGLACNLGGEKAELPSDAELQTLVKETTAAFANGVESEDFSKFRENTASEFRSAYTSESMKQNFSDFIEKKELVLPILKDAANEKAEFSPAPALREEKGYTLLNANGQFPTSPNAVKFKYEYVRRDGKWQLLKLEINL